MAGSHVTHSRPNPTDEAYGEVERVMNMSLLTDQQLDGLILWVPGEMMSIAGALIVWIKWWRQEEEKIWIH